MRQLGRIVGDFSKATVAVTRSERDPLETQTNTQTTTATGKPEIKGDVAFDHVSLQVRGLDLQPARRTSTST
ncbi:MAG: hypothetical protein MZU97_13020 [Bacillus subtilis]|nr:hypothetical protein [Bacillus subtilis]